MKYQITVEKVIDPEADKKYPDKVEIYQQTVEELNIPELVKWINSPQFGPSHQ